VKKRYVFLVIYAVLAGIVVSIAMISAMPKDHPENTFLPRSIDSSDLHFKKIWDDEEIVVPGPLAFPIALTETADYIQWEHIGNIKTFIYTDENKQKYVIQAYAFTLDKAQKRRPFIPNMARYRPDGTMDMSTVYYSDGMPETWTVYADDGVTRKTEIKTRKNRPNDYFVQCVFEYQPDGNIREYRANSKKEIYLEWMLNSKKKVLEILNGGHRFDSTENETK
jgi:hypothetical protein